MFIDDDSTQAIKALQSSFKNLIEARDAIMRESNRHIGTNKDLLLCLASDLTLFAREIDDRTVKLIKF